VPQPPAPFPAPPGPVPPPPVIPAVRGIPTAAPIIPGVGPTAPPVISAAPASPSVYRGGNYGELETQSITGYVVGPALTSARAGGMYSGAGLPGQVDSPLEMSGSLTGHILARGLAEGRKRERRQRVRTAIWVTIGLLGFVTAIAVIVDILAGDFISSLFRTFASFAG
jgi:hypothetical protein